MGVPETYLREAWPRGVSERAVDQGELCLVRRLDSDTPAVTDALDRLERVNRRALKAWTKSGRAL